MILNCHWMGPLFVDSTINGAVRYIPENKGEIYIGCVDIAKVLERVPKISCYVLMYG